MPVSLRVTHRPTGVLWEAGHPKNPKPQTPLLFVYVKVKRNKYLVDVTWGMPRRGGAYEYHEGRSSGGIEPYP